jgi:hypothetical protein
MLKKERKMRRVLYFVLIVAMLAIPASTAFAGEKEQIPDGWWLLGELWWTPDYGDIAFDVWAPFERVDAYMWRPPTCDVWDYDFGYCVCADYDFVAETCVNQFLSVWPLTQAPIMGTWWMSQPGSDYRRMSYAEDYFLADMFGGYYAEFMLPRDEVWFPCSFPLKWKCNFITPTGIEYHSPAAMAYECWMEGLNLVCLDWPWAVAPYDTIAPVVIDIFNSENMFPYGFEYELEIAGMFWKLSDIP